MTGKITIRQISEYIPPFYNSHKHLKDIRMEISLFCVQRLYDNFSKDDCREFLELA